MKKLGIFSLIAGLVLLLAGCGNEEWSWRQKLTIEVETPTGVVVGHSVTAARMFEMGRVAIIGFPGGARGEIHGEAVFVEVARGKYLFVLLEGMVGLGSYLIDDSGMSEMSTIGPLLEKANWKRVIPPKHYPMLVTFTNINDPMSAKKVDPADLAATFGAGFKLKSMTLAIADEPVTTGRVEKVLRWLLALKGGYLHGGSTSKGAPLRLHGGAFKVGEN